MQVKIIHVQTYHTDDETANTIENEEQDKSIEKEMAAQEKTIGEVPDANKIITGRVYL